MESTFDRARGNRRGPSPLTRFVDRLSDEGVFALIMAIGILIVLTITVTSVITYTSAGARGPASTSRVSVRTRSPRPGSTTPSPCSPRTAATRPGSEPSRRLPATGPRRSRRTRTGARRRGARRGPAPTRTWTIKSIGSTPNPTGPSASPVDANALCERRDPAAAVQLRPARRLVRQARARDPLERHAERDERDLHELLQCVSRRLRHLRYGRDDQGARHPRRRRLGDARRQCRRRQRR